MTQENLSPTTLARYFDSTLLKLDATEADIKQLCEEAAQNNCFAVCLYQTGIKQAAEILSGTQTNIATVVGFPSGRTCVASKEVEIVEAARAGAHEVDIVMNYPALREGDPDLLAGELDHLCNVARQAGLLSKIIVETCYLSDEQILDSLKLCEDAGADYIKTSTGFGSAGAQVEHIRMWAEHRKSIRIKASGGIRTLADARAAIEAGADRIGLSCATAILAEAAKG